MSSKKRTQRTLRRSRARIREYLYGSDRESQHHQQSAFAGGGAGAVTC